MPSALSIPVIWARLHPIQFHGRSRTSVRIFVWSQQHCREFVLLGPAQPNAAAARQAHPRCGQVQDGRFGESPLERVVGGSQFA